MIGHTECFKIVKKNCMTEKRLLDTNVNFRSIPNYA